MNTQETKKFIEDRNIVALRADKTGPAPEVDRLLEQLGNKSGSIPFYAIFPADTPNKPILLGAGPYTSSKPFLEAFEQASGKQASSESLAQTATE